jgi:hypothetical protein
MSGAFAHLPRDRWRDTLARLLRLIGSGPVYFTCHRGKADLDRFNDPLLGDVHVSAATEDEVGALLRSLGVSDLSVDVRPDLRLDRHVPWVVALGRVKG